jgi:hypothetical protein
VPDDDSLELGSVAKDGRATELTLCLGLRVVLERSLPDFADVFFVVGALAEDVDLVEVLADAADLALDFVEAEECVFVGVGVGAGLGVGVAVGVAVTTGQNGKSSPLSRSTMWRASVLLLAVIPD